MSHRAQRARRSFASDAHSNARAISTSGWFAYQVEVIAHVDRSAANDAAVDASQFPQSGSGPGTDDLCHGGTRRCIGKHFQLDGSHHKSLPPVSWKLAGVECDGS